MSSSSSSSCLFYSMTNSSELINLEPDSSKAHIEKRKICNRNKYKARKHCKYFKCTLNNVLRKLLRKKTVQYSVENLNLNKLKKGYRKLIVTIFMKLLILQNKDKAISAKRRIKILEFNKETNSNFKSSENSLNTYTENFNSNQSKSMADINLLTTSVSSDVYLDRFSSIFGNISDDFFKEYDKDKDYENIAQTKAKSLEVEKLQPFKNKQLELNEYYNQAIEPIQHGMVPQWHLIDLAEQIGIKELLKKWQISVDSNFKCLKNVKQKRMRSLSLNRLKSQQKGVFDFTENRFDLKIGQLEFLEICKKHEKEMSKIKPNTRLVIKCFKEFINAFDCFEEAKLNYVDSNFKKYWAQFNIFLTHMSKALLRATFYVHENLNLFRSLITLPPIYLLESDEYNNSEIQTNLETLHKYIWLCLDQLNENLRYSYTGRDNNNSIKKNNHNKMKLFKCVLNSLLRLVQVSSLVRDDLILKNSRELEIEKSNKTSIVEFYSHYIATECKQVKDHLKYIIRNFD